MQLVKCPKCGNDMEIENPTCKFCGNKFQIKRNGAIVLGISAFLFLVCIINAFLGKTFIAIVFLVLSAIILPAWWESRKKITIIEIPQETSSPYVDFKTPLPATNKSQEIKHNESTIILPKHKEIYFLDVIERIDRHFALSYQYENVKIAFPKLDAVELGDFLSFVPEPDNAYDNKAIKIMHHNTMIGYVFRGKLQDMINNYIKYNWPIEARIDSISEDTLTYSIGFYKDFNTFDSLSATLTRTSKKDSYDMSRQENLSYVSVDDLLNMEYDFDTETYVVTDRSGNELGELSKSISEKLYLEDNKYDYKGLCTYIDMDDNLKYKCKIQIYKTPL